MLQKLFLICSLIFTTFGVQAAEAVIPAGSVSTRYSCEEAARKIANKEFANPDEQFELSMIVANCGVTSYNNSQPDPDKKKVVVVTMNPDDQKILFNTITLGEAKKARSVCQSLVSSFAGQQLQDTGDPIYIAVAVGGRYSCDAYFDAAVKSDPMLIVFPTFIPGVKVTSDVIGVARTAGQGIKQHLDNHPGTVVSPTMGAQAELLKEVGKKVGGDVGKAAEKAGENLQKGLDCIGSLFKKC